MKCVCGYFHMTKEEIEQEDVIFQDELLEKNGDRPFMRIDVETFPIGSTRFYRCPVCGTLKM